MVLTAVGLVLLVIGLIYVTTEASQLPTLLGNIRGGHHSRTLRGVVTLVVGGVMLGGGVVIALPWRRDRSAD
jgi:hypothetical protein